MYKTWKDELLPQAKILENKLNIDWELYKTLLKFRSHSKSRTQDELRDWLSGWIKENIKDALVEKDKYGNLYVTKGDSDIYPCVVAHLDINQDVIKDYTIVQTDRYIFGFNNETGKQCGLGCDDKNGLYFGLLMLQTQDILKCFFPLNEEIGCQGTHAAEMDFFWDCSMLVQLDRNSSHNDISDFTNGVEVVSQEFKSTSAKVLHKFGYKYTRCMYTDIGELVSQGCGCVAFNISCGYFNEHMDDEVTSIPLFVNAMHFAWEIITTFGYKKRWEHKISKKKWGNASAYSYIDEIDYHNSAFGEYEEIKDVYHYCPESDYKFTSEDEEYIQDCLDTGTCPLCSSNNMEMLKTGEDYCLTCFSIYNIPVNKSLFAVEEQMEELIKDNREGVS